MLDQQGQGRVERVDLGEPAPRQGGEQLAAGEGLHLGPLDPGQQVAGIVQGGIGAAHEVEHGQGVIGEVAADGGRVGDGGLVDRQGPAVAEAGGQVEQAGDPSDGTDELGGPVGDVGQVAMVGVEAGFDLGLEREHGGRGVGIQGQDEQVAAADHPGGLCLVQQRPGERLQLLAVRLHGLVGDRGSTDPAVAHGAGRQRVEEAGEEAAASEPGPILAGPQHLWLDSQANGQRGLLDVLGRAALAVDSDRVASVALQVHVQAGSAALIAPGHHVEHAALRAEQGDAAVVGEQGRQRLGGRIVGQQPGDRRDMDGFGSGSRSDRLGQGSVGAVAGRLPRGRLGGVGGALRDLPGSDRLQHDRLHPGGLVPVEVDQRPGHVAEHRRLAVAGRQGGGGEQVQRFPPTGAELHLGEATGGRGQRRQHQHARQVGRGLGGGRLGPHPGGQEVGQGLDRERWKVNDGPQGGRLLPLVLDAAVVGRVDDHAAHRRTALRSSATSSSTARSRTMISPTRLPQHPLVGEGVDLGFGLVDQGVDLGHADGQPVAQQLTDRAEGRPGRVGLPRCPAVPLGAASSWRRGRPACCQADRARSPAKNSSRASRVTRTARPILTERISPRWISSYAWFLPIGSSPATSRTFSVS